MNLTQSPPFSSDKRPENRDKCQFSGNFLRMYGNFVRGGLKQNIKTMANNSNPFYLFFLWLLSDYNFSR